MKKKQKLEYWVYIDDSGNIELSSSDKYFTYAALVFNNYDDVVDFRTKYQTALIKISKKNKEIKASSTMSQWKRKEIFDVIISSNVQLISVTEDKTLSNKLSQIETDYEHNLKESKKLPLKGKLLIKKMRQKQYAYHKGYLIAQLICLTSQSIKKQKNMKINIIIDNENLSSIENNFINYLRYEQGYLKFRSYEYTFRMEDSKNDYCLQGADFLANTIYRLYNKKDNEKFNYINDQKNIVTKEFPFIPNPKKEKIIKKQIDNEFEIQIEK